VNEFWLKFLSYWANKVCPWQGLFETKESFPDIEAVLSVVPQVDQRFIIKPQFAQFFKRWIALSTR